VFAGSFTAGSSDGAGLSASFNGPYGIATDSAGNVYVSEQTNQTIRKITPAGVVTTIAGVAGSPGDTDGPAAQARFNVPVALAVDSAGNLYIADSGNRAIRKLSSAGVVSTLARMPNGGYPAGIALDGAGNLYVSEGPEPAGLGGAVPNTIDVVPAGGAISTFAGQPAAGTADGMGIAARFNQPRGLAVDASGNLYVADGGNSTIREITPAGVVTTVAGMPGAPSGLPADGAGSQARLIAPAAVAASANGNLYFTDATGVRRGILAANTQGPVRFVNVSARGTVADSSPLVAGFIVAGSACQTVLVRAVGPTLAQFGVANFLANPVLQVNGRSGQLIASSASGQNLDDLNNAARLVGAFPLAVTSNGDVGVVLTLPPGTYTASAAAPAGASGTVLLEVYEVP
jgi:streptogramin lyase